MRMMRVSKKSKVPTLVIASLGITSLVLLITGGVLGGPIIIGSGIALLVCTCGFAVAIRTSHQSSLV